MEDSSVEAYPNGILYLLHNKESRGRQLVAWVDLMISGPNFFVIFLART